VALARLTASLTQSLIGASLVWHMRQMSPVDTSWEKMVLPAVENRGSTVQRVSCRHNDALTQRTRTQLRTQHSKGYRPDTLS
jgi:hypothetical protein